MAIQYVIDVPESGQADSNRALGTGHNNDFPKVIPTGIAEGGDVAGWLNSNGYLYATQATHANDADSLGRTGLQCHGWTQDV
jgi:hypothetical protein|tara:strand:+ start:930 stop:1175 length:246 start_codon:yes stop_codon:yes gene_type:complete